MFNSPMTKRLNTVSVDLSSYAATTALNAKRNALTFSAPLSRTTKTISLDLSTYLTTATASTTYEPILTFNSPMTKTGNTVSIDLSSYATTTALSSYSPLGGGTMSGTLK
jgi:hypothetical protein